MINVFIKERNAVQIGNSVGVTIGWRWMKARSKDIGDEFGVVVFDLSDIEQLELFEKVKRKCRTI